MKLIKSLLAGLLIVGFLAGCEAPESWEDQIESQNHPTSTMYCIDNCVTLGKRTAHGSIRVFQDDTLGVRCFLQLYAGAAMTCVAIEE